MQSMLVLTVFLLLSSCQRSVVGSPRVDPTVYPIGDYLASDTASSPARTVAITIAPYSAQLGDRMNRVLAEVATPLVKGRPESSLGNWTADLLLAAAREVFPERTVAFAIQNYGGIRVTEIGTGPLTVAELYELMPFDNELVLVQLSGTQLAEFLTHTIAGGGWPVSAGVSIEQVDGEPIQVLIGGQPLRKAATYYVAMPDYVANGGDQAAMLVGTPQQASGRLVRDLLIEQAARLSEPIRVPAASGRIQLAHEP